MLLKCCKLLCKVKSVIVGEYDLLLHLTFIYTISWLGLRAQVNWFMSVLLYVLIKWKKKKTYANNCFIQSPKEDLDYLVFENLYGKVPAWPFFPNFSDFLVLPDRLKMDIFFLKVFSKACPLVYISNSLKMLVYIFFYLLFGCSTANFGPLSRRQSHSPSVNHLRCTYLTRRSPGAL